MIHFPKKKFISIISFALFPLIFSRRWKSGSLEAHPTEKAIIVNYKLEAAVYRDIGDVQDPMLEDKKVRYSGIYIWCLINAH